MSHVFISYAAKDSEIASRVRRHLIEAGIQTWMDTDLKPGADWETVIREALRNASSGLVLLSPAASNSPEVAREYKTILAQNKRLYAALVAPVAPKDFPFHLRTIQYVDLTEDFENGVNHLIEAVQTQTNLADALQYTSSSTGKHKVVFEIEGDLNNVADLLVKLTEAGAKEIQVVDVDAG